MSKLKEAMDLITLIRKVREGMAQPEKVDDLNLGTAAALLAFNKLSLHSDNLLDTLHEYVEMKEPKYYVLGEEVLCPDGVGTPPCICALGEQREVEPVKQVAALLQPRTPKRELAEYSRAELLSLARTLRGTVQKLEYQVQKMQHKIDSLKREIKDGSSSASLGSFKLEGSKARSRQAMENDKARMVRKPRSQLHSSEHQKVSRKPGAPVAHKSAHVIKVKQKGRR